MDNDVAAMIERADGLRLAGRFEEAADAYEQVLERVPALPDAWYNLGWVRRQARLFEPALDAYRQALDQGVSGPEEVHLNRAVILSDHLARPDLARAELKAALAIAPAYLPALLNLGNLEEDLGNRAEAADAYRKALEAAPGDALALSRLAGVTPADQSDEVVAALRTALKERRSAGERADLGFALGRLLDLRQAHDEAFDVYSAANRDSRQSFGPAYPGYDPEAVEKAIDRLIAAFGTPAQPTGPQSPAIFICGLFRSGSTLTEQILASHDDVDSGGELDLIPALASRMNGYPQPVATAGEDDLDAWRRFYLSGLAPHSSGARFVTDKRPDNFLHLGLVKTLFPKAKIVHTRRNRLDNLLSLYFLHLGPAMPFALDLADTAHWHGQYERLMAHWKTLYAGDIFDLDYDRHVDEPRPVLERLLDFLGLDWDDRLLDFHKRPGAVKTASVWQVREPLHARSNGRWRNYRDQLKSALGESFAEH